MPFLRDEAKLRAGQRILINGASGNVGTVAVQLAKLMGAQVTAVCSARNAELVRGLGADEVIDYAVEDFTRRTEAWDVIFDAVGKSSFGRCRGALRRDGTYMTTVPALSIVWPMLRGRDRQGRRGLLATTGLRKPEAKSKDLELLSTAIERKELMAVIDRTYGLDEIVEANRYVATERKRGSVVVEIVPEVSHPLEP
jgi:NADPH:quinone reductase-like Zn-dependent oxidoreductase